MQRITKLSKQNLIAADRAELVQSPGTGFLWIKVWVGDNSAFLWGAEDMLSWRTYAEAMRFLRRFRAGMPVEFWGREPAL